ncbi:MAG: ParB/RepB/Spo0J family partition protein [Planctomycetota bacterium]
MERRLSRGLDSLMGKGGVHVASSQSAQSIPVDQIEPNPSQPRKDFDEAQLASLKESIANDGLLQPILVRRKGVGYELIAGERRLRACKELGLPRIPAMIRPVEDRQQLILALVENLQRSDLNPVDEARAFRQLQEGHDLTHEEIARRVGRERSTVSNALRLLDLPPTALEAVSRGTLSAGHARALLPLAQSPKFDLFLERVLEEGLSVRQTERVVRELVHGKPPGGEPDAEGTAPPRSERARSPAVIDLEEQLRAAWHVMVRIKTRSKGGDVTFRCASREEFNDLVDRLRT